MRGRPAGRLLVFPPIRSHADGRNVGPGCSRDVLRARLCRGSCAWVLAGGAVVSSDFVANNTGPELEPFDSATLITVPKSKVLTDEQRLRAKWLIAELECTTAFVAAYGRQYDICRTDYIVHDSAIREELATLLGPLPVPNPDADADEVEVSF